MVAAVVTISANTMGALMPRSREELLAAVQAGEWLRAGEVAIVLGIGRTSAHRLLTAGQLGWRYKPGGKQRQADPADVQRLIKDADQVHRGDGTGQQSAGR